MLEHFRRAGHFAFPGSEKEVNASFAKALTVRPGRHHRHSYWPYQSMRRQEYARLASMTDGERLALFVEDIHSWLTCYPADNVPQELISPLYRVFADVARQAKITIAGGDASLWRYVAAAFPQKEVMDSSWEEGAKGFAQILNAVEQHVQLVETHPFEDSWQARSFSSAFLWLMQYAQPPEKDTDLRDAVRALTPLWQHARFMERYRP